MTDSPERIWIEAGDDCPYFYGEDELHEAGSPVTGYIRADLVDAKDAEIDRLWGDLKQSHRDYMDLQIRHDAHFSAWQYAKFRANAAGTEIDRLRDALARMIDELGCDDADCDICGPARTALNREGE